METVPKPPEPVKITVAGVTFDETQIVSAVIKIDGREIHITKKEENKEIGFNPR